MHTCDGCVYLASDGTTCLRDHYPDLEKPLGPKVPKDAWYIRFFKTFIGLFGKEKK